jgi:AcrR family transcriptional regulator
VLNGGPSCIEPGCPMCRELREAAIEVAMRDGIDAVTMTAIKDEAGTPHGTAKRHYRSAEECLVAAYDEAAGDFFDAFANAFTAADSWPDRLHEAADAVMSLVRARPRAARFCAVEATRSSSGALRQRELVMRQRYVAALTDQYARDGGDEELPALRFEVMVGAGRHAVGRGLESGRFSGADVDRQLHELIGMFEPVPATPA